MNQQSCVNIDNTLPLCPPPFFAVLRYSVSVSISITELAALDGRGLLDRVTISERNKYTVAFNETAHSVYLVYLH